MNSFENDFEAHLAKARFNYLRFKGSSIKDIIDKIGIDHETIFRFEKELEEEYPENYRIILSKKPHSGRYTLIEQEVFEYLVLKNNYIYEDALFYIGIETGANSHVSRYHKNLLKYASLRIEKDFPAREAEKEVNRSKTICELYEKQIRNDYRKNWDVSNHRLDNVIIGDVAYVNQRYKIYLENPKWNPQKNDKMDLPEKPSRSINYQKIKDLKTKLEQETNKNENLLKVIQVQVLEIKELKKEKEDLFKDNQIKDQIINDQNRKIKDQEKTIQDQKEIIEEHDDLWESYELERNEVYKKNQEILDLLKPKR